MRQKWVEQGVALGSRSVAQSIGDQKRAERGTPRSKTRPRSRSRPRPRRAAARACPATEFQRNSNGLKGFLFKRDHLSSLWIYTTDVSFEKKQKRDRTWSKIERIASRGPPRLAIVSTVDENPTWSCSKIAPRSAGARIASTSPTHSAGTPSSASEHAGGGGSALSFVREKALFD